MIMPAREHPLVQTTLHIVFAVKSGPAWCTSFESLHHSSSPNDIDPNASCSQSSSRDNVVEQELENLKKVGSACQCQVGVPARKSGRWCITLCTTPYCIQCQQGRYHASMQCRPLARSHQNPFQWQMICWYSCDLPHHTLLLTVHTRMCQSHQREG